MRKASIANLKRTAMLRGLTREVIRPGGELIGRGIVGAQESLNVAANTTSGLIYSNGTGNGLGGAQLQVFSVVDDVVFASGATVTSIKFTTLEGDGTLGGGGTCQITSANVLLILSSDIPNPDVSEVTTRTGTIVSRNLLVADIDTDGFGAYYSRYEYEISFSTLTLAAATTYYIGLQCVCSGVNSWEVCLWEFCTDNGTAEHREDLNNASPWNFVLVGYPSDGKQVTFQLYGTTGATGILPIFVAGADNPDNPDIDFWIP